MRRSSLFLQIFVPFLGVILLALLAATWEASTSMHRFHLQQTQETLEVRARVFERQLADKMNEQQAAPLDALCKDLGKLSNTRVTVVLPSGKVIGDTEENPATMDNHADRPEIIEALAGRVGHARRYSHTLRANLIYVAVPVMKSGACLGIIRTSASLVSVDYALQQVLFRIMGGSIIIAVLAALVSLGLARRITRPLQQMIAGAERFAGGHLETHLPRPKSAELARLAETMNAMATQLNDRIQTVNRQRNELDSVLASMVEGVLAVDNQENIISMNRAAAALFGVSMESVRGRSFREVVRNLKLQECVTRMLSRYEPFEEEVELAIPEERCLRVSATGLRSEDGSDLGALLVMDDITELRMLERVRTDFVANVSHEIRTPVTSIKGYAETLLGEDQKDPETLKKFLEIIVRQADRLTALVEDILSLSALEQSEAKKDVVFEHVQLNAIIEESVYLCTPRPYPNSLKSWSRATKTLPCTAMPPYWSKPSPICWTMP